MNIYFLGGGFGTDAGGWYIGPDGKVHRSPPWAPDAMLELSHAISVIRAASQLKTPGLADAAIKTVMDFTQKELGQHLTGGGVVVLGG